MKMVALADFFGPLYIFTLVHRQEIFQTQLLKMYGRRRHVYVNVFISFVLEEDEELTRSLFPSSIRPSRLQYAPSF